MIATALLLLLLVAGAGMAQQEQGVLLLPGEGILVSVSPETIPAPYTQCWRETFDVSMKTSLDALAEKICPKSEWILACRPVGQDNFTLLAQTNKQALFQNQASATSAATWYFGRDSSLGFAPRGRKISRASCDYDFSASSSQPDAFSTQRLCLQTKMGFISNGFRCGNHTFLGANALWERVILHADAPTAAPTRLPSRAPTTSTPTRSPTRAPTSQSPTRSPRDTKAPVVPTPAPTLGPTLPHPTQSPTYTNQFFSGIKTYVDPKLYDKWEPCWSQNYAVRLVTEVDRLFGEMCTKKRLMLACGNSSVWVVAANAPREDVLYETPMDDTHLANGVDWYYTATMSFGFAPEGAAILRDDCDVLDERGNQRLCIHQGEESEVNYIEFGYRCGDFTNEDAFQFNRMLYQTDEDEDIV